MRRHVYTLLMIVVAVATRSAFATDIDYLRDVKPILKARCFACHGALKQEAGLRLDSGSLIRKGSDSGKIVSAGNAKDSVLLERVVASDESERMPPEGKPLTRQQIDALRRWIVAGAKSPVDENPEEDPRKHWAFQRPVQSLLPAVSKSNWVRTPIDAFILKQQEQRGIEPLPDASKEILLRRVYLDLIGLPPTRSELHAFIADESPDAYERVVDQLLASPHYGERWGRHWMDIWRYSDWYGRRQVNDVRNSYPHIWRWRDWIINSLNDDKGYEQMVAEMLAADELFPEDDERMPALGYIVRNWFSLNYDTWKQDLVEHTGKAFLGLRLNCCHCHDHKYDPISQREYFRFRAFFEPLELRHDRVPGGAELTKYIRYTPSSGGSLKPIKAGLPRVYDHYFDDKTTMYRLGDTRDKIEGADVRPGGPAIIGGDQLKISEIELPTRAWYPGLKSFAINDDIKRREQAVELAGQDKAKAAASLKQVSNQLDTAEKQLAAAREAVVETPSTISRNNDHLIGWWRFEGEDSTDGFLSDAGGKHPLKRITHLDPPATPFPLAKEGIKVLPFADIANKQAARFQQTRGFGYLAADGADTIYANQFTLEALVHFDVAAKNFNRTIADYDGSWTLLHRGLDDRRFELRLRYFNAKGQLRDVSTGQKLEEALPMILETGRDYFIAVTMSEKNVTIWSADLTSSAPLQAFQFSRSSKDTDFSLLHKPRPDTMFKIGNSDGTGRVVGLIDEVRYTRVAYDETVIAAAIGQSENADLRQARAKVNGLRQQVDLAQKQLESAKLRLIASKLDIDAFKARINAESTKYDKSSSEAAKLIESAASLSHQAKVANSAATLADAEANLAELESENKPDAKKIEQAHKAVSTAMSNQKALEKKTASATEYEVLGPQYPKRSTGRRRALAQWLTDGKNPLTARVAINHIWGRHFGTPLVASVFDFGRGSKRPTHPELLDWLAVELMSGADKTSSEGWGMKRIHRLIVTSSVYRLSSRPPVDHPNNAIDGDNNLYWRFKRKRLEAELVRDAMQYIASNLDRRLGGHDIDPKQEADSTRRSLYFSVYPENGGVMRFMTLFNPPNPTDCYRRSETIVPQQALAMSNSTLTLNSSRELMESVAQSLSASKETDAEFIAFAFERILTRRPTDQELNTCHNFFERQRQIYKTNNVSDGIQRSRNSLIRVLLSHNDFITVH